VLYRSSVNLMGEKMRSSLIILISSIFVSVVFTSSGESSLEIISGAEWNQMRKKELINKREQMNSLKAEILETLNEAKNDVKKVEDEMRKTETDIDESLEKLNKRIEEFKKRTKILDERIESVQKDMDKSMKEMQTDTEAIKKRFNKT
jgi:flagellar capping protein FliD